MRFNSEIHIRLDENLKQELVRVANHYQSSPSQIIRHLLTQNLPNLDKRNRMYV
jgi:antitoxin component of RelBE/YafQ-DinJ toxin-antitoxin module